MNKQEKAKRVDRSVRVPPHLLVLAGSASAGVLLSQLVYWFSGSKLRVKREGRMWLAKRRCDWLDECGLSAREYDTAIRKLVKRSLVETRVWRFAGSPTVHLWLDMKRLNSLIGAIQVSDRKVPSHRSVSSYTENTNRDYDIQKHERAAHARAHGRSVREIEAVREKRALE